MSLEYRSGLGLALFACLCALMSPPNRDSLSSGRLATMRHRYTLPALPCRGILWERRQKHSCALTLALEPSETHKTV